MYIVGEPPGSVCLLFSSHDHEAVGSFRPPVQHEPLVLSHGGRGMGDDVDHRLHTNVQSAEMRHRGPPRFTWVSPAALHDDRSPSDVGVV
jgi:hypothetical protein